MATVNDSLLTRRFSEAKRQLPMGNTVNVNGGNFKRASESIVLPGSNVVNVNGGNGAPVPAAPAKRQTAPTAPGLGTSGNTINLNGGNAGQSFCDLLRVRTDIPPQRSDRFQPHLRYLELPAHPVTQSTSTAATPSARFPQGPLSPRTELP